jgi:hypothetical protein
MYTSAFYTPKLPSALEIWTLQSESLEKKKLRGLDYYMESEILAEEHCTVMKWYGHCLAETEVLGFDPCHLREPRVFP